MLPSGGNEFVLEAQTFSEEMIHYVIKMRG